MYQLRKAGWKPKEDDANLIIGRAVHEGLAHWGVSKNDNEALTKALMVTVGLDENGIDVVASLLLGYFEEYKTDVLVTICTETDVTLPITPDINFRFKMDGVVEFEGKPWIKESKTTGQKPGAFWSKYAMDRQATGYIWGARKYFDLPIEGVLVDALFKPSSKVPLPTYDRQFFSPHPLWLKAGFMISKVWVKRCYVQKPARIIGKVGRVLTHGEGNVSSSIIAQTITAWMCYEQHMILRNDSKRRRKMLFSDADETETGYLKVGFYGGPGSGKTYTALKIATAIGKTYLIDTELGSEAYKRLFKCPDGSSFKVLHTRNLEEAMAGINEAVKAGGEVLVVDQVTTLWEMAQEGYIAK